MTAPAQSLRVSASGICCAVGYTAEASACALRAGLDHFQESTFVAEDGSPVRIARLPEADIWGAPRLARWAARAIEACVASIAATERHSIPILLLTASLSRPMSEERAQFETARAAQAALDRTFPPHSRIIPGDRAALGTGLALARQLLDQEQLPGVLVVGLDSYLNAASINHYLSEERLLVPGNRDGFIPGEAAAAVLLERSRPDTSGLHVIGIGQGQESGRPDGSVPSRAQGLSHAIRAAVADAGADAADLDFRLSDQNGEGFFAREAANALTRVAVPGGHKLPTLTTADCTGEIGAATGPLMLAWLHRLLAHANAPGRCGLIHLASDEGARCALIVRHQP